MTKATTMKVSTTTRDRLRSLSGERDTLEDVVIAALDVYEAQEFWAAADAAHAVETPEQRSTRRRDEAANDGWMDAAQ